MGSRGRDSTVSHRPRAGNAIESSELFVDDGGYRQPNSGAETGWRWLETGGSPQLENSFAKFFNQTIKQSI